MTDKHKELQAVFVPADSKLTTHSVQQCAKLLDVVEALDRAPTQSERMQMAHVAQELYPSLQPASSLPGGTEQILAILRRLMTHYPSSSRDLVLETGRWEDWLDDVECYPLDVIRAAANAWRRSPTEWAPTPGKFIELCERICAPRRIMSARIQRLLAREDDPPPPSKEEREEGLRILQEARLRVIKGGD